MLIVLGFNSIVLSGRHEVLWGRIGSFLFVWMLIAIVGGLANSRVMIADRSYWKDRAKPQAGD